MLVGRLALLFLGTLVIVWVSRSSLRDIQSHGFYRFFAWELILVLFVLNLNYWFIEPFSFTQIIAWTLLSLSLVLIFLGVLSFRRSGQIDSARDDPALVGIEKTTELVTSGIYSHIRHPFYSSLLSLVWGIFFKHPNWVGIVLGTGATILLVITAQKEEIENIAFFGDQYRAYMKSTRMFIPFIV